MISKWVILIGVGICVAVTFIYVYLMHYCSFWLSWISVGLIQLMLVGIGYFAFDYRRDQIDLDATYAEESMATWLKWITWVSWIMAGIYYIVILCSFQSLRVAVAVIETASSFVADSKRLLFVPLLYFFVTLVASVMFLSGLICVSSIGKIEAGSVATQTKSIEWDSSTEGIYWGMIFGFIWTICFILAMSEFVTIVSAIKGDYTRQLIIAPYFRARGIGDTILNLIKIFPWRADQRQGWGDECEARRWLQRDGYCQFTGRQLRACRDFGLQALSISKTKVTPGSTQIVFVDGDDAVQEGPIELLARTMGIDFIGGRSPYYCGLEKPIPHSFLSDKDNPNMNMYWLREANQMIADFLADGIPFPVEGRTEDRERNRCRSRCTDSTCEQIWKP